MAKALQDEAGYQLLSSRVKENLSVAKQKGRKMLEHRQAYQELGKRLQTLPDSLTQPVMVPFTSKAFMPGQLVHTNEVQVLLGDNWFIETSARHASDIVRRRIGECDRILGQVEQELKLAQGWVNQTHQAAGEEEGCVDIKEEFDEKKEAEWKREHRRKVQKEKKVEDKADVNEEDLWRRLEELEVQEELEKQWGEEDDTSEESEESDESDISDEDEEYENENDGDKQPLSFTNLGGTSLTSIDENLEKSGERRVSWVVKPSVENKDRVKTIEFDHSNNPSVTGNSLSDTNGDPKVPSDIPKRIPRKPKSILKESKFSDVPSQPQIKSEIVNEKMEERSENLLDAVSEVVLERTAVENESSATHDVPEEPKRVSRFKAARQRGKL